MSTEWNWPGARWWRVDLHTHSPASYDFKPPADREAEDWTAWVEAVKRSGVHAVAVTDHNTARGVGPLQVAAGSMADAPVIYPGFEITASDGTHLLFLFDPSCKQQHAEAALTLARVPVDQRGTDTARSTLNVEQLLSLECERGVIIVAAHVNGPAGLLDHEGQQRMAGLSHSCLAAVEVDPARELDASWIDGSRREIGRAVPQVYGSDSHAFDEIGRRFTWVKMTRPDAEGLRLALLDGEFSLRRAHATDLDDPNHHADCLIESISVLKARYAGRPDPLTVAFNPWLNVLIGSRGTGKSTLVDLCRVALRREGELEPNGPDTSLRDSFEKRMRVPPDRTQEGLLTDDTFVEVIYRKDGERFAISWDKQKSATPISRLNGNERVPEDGDIRDRFPVRIYSQKQLFDLAKDPNALLTVIDDSAAVGGAELTRLRKEAETRYLARRAEVRALRAEVADLPAREATLADVRRKLQLLEQGGNAKALNDYRLRRRDDSTWTSIRQAAAEAVREMGQSASERLSVADIDLGTESESDDATLALKRTHTELHAVVARLRETVLDAVETANAEIGKVLGGKDATLWISAVSASEREYQLVSQRLAEAGIGNPDEYRDMLQRSARLEKEIESLTRRSAAINQRESEAAAELAQYRAKRSELTARRAGFAAATSSDLIKVAVNGYAKRTAQRESLIEFLRDTLGINGFDADYSALAATSDPDPSRAWAFTALDDLVARLREVLSDGQKQWNTKDRRFEVALRKLQPERIDRVAMYLPEDAVDVSFRDHRDSQNTWRQLAQGSPGQQTAALLAFVLGYGHEPIILDQPEDDLDNTLIYELLVRRIRESKTTRQIIIVTHNPNIVVHGDAELVVSLKVANGQTQVAFAGGLQEREARSEVCKVMEGGRTAFESRYRRIMLPESARNG